MSQVFENEEALARQSIAFRCFIEDREYVHIRSEQYDSSIFPKVDYLIEVNGKRVAIEVKGVRKVESIEDKHQPIVGIRKLVALQKYVNEHSFDFAYIIWAYDDGLKYAELRELEGSVKWSGRAPRQGAVNDSELMFHTFKNCLTNKSYL